MKIVLNLLLVMSYLFLTQGVMALMPETFAQSGLLVSVVGLLIAITIVRRCCMFRLAGFIITLLALSGVIQSVPALALPYPIITNILAFGILVAVTMIIKSRTLAVASTFFLAQFIPFGMNLPSINEGPFQIMSTLSDGMQALGMFYAPILYLILILVVRNFGNKINAMYRSLVRCAEITSYVCLLISLFVMRMGGAFVGNNSETMLQVDPSGFVPSMVDGTLVLPQQFMLVVLVLALLFLGSMSKKENDRALFTTVTIFSLSLLFSEWFRYFASINASAENAVLGAGIIGIALTYLFGKTECALDTCEMKVAPLPKVEAKVVSMPAPKLPSKTVNNAPVKKTVKTTKKSKKK